MGNSSPAYDHIDSHITAYGLTPFTVHPCLGTDHSPRGKGRSLFITDYSPRETGHFLLRENHSPFGTDHPCHSTYDPFLHPDSTSTSKIILRRQRHGRFGEEGQSGLPCPRRHACTPPCGFVNESFNLTPRPPRPAPKGPTGWYAGLMCVGR
jgi:hypothetical protein